MQFLFTTITALIFISVSFCQSSGMIENFQSGLIVDSIEISGNDITEEFIILRELTFEEGDTVDQHTLEYNKERIYSLGIFNKVDFRTQNEKNILNINVEESWYIYPIPFFQLKDKDWDKVSYGVTVLIKNFRGRNENLSGSAILGYDPSFSIRYFKPSIFNKSDVYFNAGLSHQTVTNRSINALNIFGSSFEYTYISGNVGLGKRFGVFHKAGFDVGFNYIESPRHIKGVTASGGRIDKLINFGLGYSYNTRDLAQFSKEGILFSFYVNFKGLGINNINYQTFNIDFREYRGLFGDLIAKWRLTSRLTTGKFIPFYDYSYLGYEDAVRGHYSNEREGHHFYLGSLEFFHPIVKDINISLDFIPLLPSELLSYRVALYGQIFGDTGTIQSRGKPLSIKKFDTGYGGGISLLLLPYNVIRFEVAFDENQNIEYIIDIGASF